jgi:TATA-box binding protein (TBP) (component of TFIID and TFIIIB)
MAILNSDNNLQQLQQNLNMSKLPSTIKISTITITCHVNVKFNIANISKYLDLSNNIIAIKSLELIRSNMPIKKTRKTKTKKIKKNAFYNQVSISVGKTKGILNIKLFINGAIQITGCKSYEDFVFGMETLFKNLKNVNKGKFNRDTMQIENICYIDNMPQCENNLSIEKIKNIKIAMINSNYKIKHRIDREKLFSLMINQKIKCSYDPIIHACVNIKFEKNKQKCASIFVFEGGTIIITGAQTIFQILDAHNFIDNYIKTYFSSINKRTIENENGLQIDNESVLDSIIRKCKLPTCATKQ